MKRLYAYLENRYRLQGVFMLDRDMTYCAINSHSSCVRSVGRSTGDNRVSLALTKAWTAGLNRTACIWHRLSAKRAD